MALCGLEMAKKGGLKGNAVVATVMSNLGLDLCLKQQGIKVIRTKVGDRYVVEEMLRGGYNLGGEQAGHIVFLDHTTTGDGLITALKVLSILRENGKDLSDYCDLMKPFPQVRYDVKVREKVPLSELPELQDLISEAEKALSDRGRILVRYSGTEPVLRIMVEGEDKQLIHQIGLRLKECAERLLKGGER
jgi:phosphoglucosamine mutase